MDDATPKVGRPRKEFSFDELDKLCSLHCTQEEICFFFDMCEDTLVRRIKERFDCNFSEYYKRASGGGKMSLRRMQFESANKGNVTMQIWLGKQWLGQTDKQEVENTGQPIQIIYQDNDSKTT